ncbi:hypothetical protein [Kineococcus aurantiacus]|uniref:Uncharacterized protein n=1 Tax=Kineococcus aurantiacus TaxID=37633 RepID=A0A7Y9DNA7_9ACTN|nr:hypothetical protein [Kineococcus aurantiacus]NYD23745.1 hypothetical protein [Kineococcus aurantiacus]
MTTPSEEPGTEAAAESPTEPGYGNDTGFAQEAEEADPQVQDDAQDGDGAGPA